MSDIKEVVVPIGEGDIYVFERVVLENAEVVWTFDGIDIRFVKEEIKEIENDEQNSN